MEPVQNSLNLSGSPSIDELQQKILSLFSQKPIIKSTPFLNYVFILLNISTLTIIGLGIYALHASPYTRIRLVIENNTWMVNHKDHNSPSIASNITIGDKLVKIGGIPVDKDDFIRFPEFFQKRSEEKWWNKQRAFYGILQENNVVAVETVRNDDTKATGTTTVQNGMPFSQIIKRTLLVYLSSILWMAIGILAFLDLNGTGMRSCSKLSGKHSRKSSLKTLCAFFSVFGALYLASVAPIAIRDLTLSPPLFRMLLGFIGGLLGVYGLLGTHPIYYLSSFFEVGESEGSPIRRLLSSEKDFP